MYDDMMREKDYDKCNHIYKACCLYALCNYDEAKRECLKGPENSLQIRLMFHIAHKKNDEKNLMTYHHKIKESKEVLYLTRINYVWPLLII
jgi:intraflagellar transport protein 56